MPRRAAGPVPHVGLWVLERCSDPKFPYLSVAVAQAISSLITTQRHMRPTPRHKESLARR